MRRHRAQRSEKLMRLLPRFGCGSRMMCGQRKQVGGERRLAARRQEARHTGKGLEGQRRHFMLERQMKHLLIHLPRFICARLTEVR